MSRRDPRIGYFDSLASHWDDEEPSRETMVAQLSRHANLLSLKAGHDLLEVGCGTGKTTGWLARQVTPGRVTAIDFSPRMIARAETKGIDADFRCLDVCRDDLGRRCYDLILCFHSFPHFRDQHGPLRRFAWALKPGGRAVVMHLAGSRQINQLHAGLDGPVNRDVLPAGDEWDALLGGAGLKKARLIDRDDLFFLEAVAAD